MPKPPTLTKQVIRKLGKELGQLEDEALTDDALMSKKKQKNIGKGKNKGKGDEGPEKTKKNNEDNSN